MDTRAIEFKTFLVYKIANSHLVDSLPYYDEYTEQDQLLVTDLIETEKRSFEIDDYLKDLPTLQSNFETCNSFKHLLEGVKGFRFNKTRYEIENTQQKSNPIDELHNLKLIYCYTQSKNHNLKLLKQFGVKSWTEHNKNLESYLRKLENHVINLENSNSQVNIARKIEQEDSKTKLCELKSQ